MTTLAKDIDDILTQRRKGAKRCRVAKGFLCGFA